MQNLIEFVKDHKKEFLIGSVLTYGLFLVRRKYRPSKEFETIKNIKLTNRVAIITGSNSGIGYETALDLACRDATVILACRNQTLTQNVIEIIKKKSGNSKVYYEHLDLSSLESVKIFCSNVLNNYKQLDILINNAGIASCPKQTTKDGFDLQLQTNYLGHYLMTRLLLDLIKQSSDGRIVNLTSILYKSAKINWDDINQNDNYNPTGMYKQSKLCLILFTNYLKESFKLNGTKNVKAYSVSPGLVWTNLGRYSEKGVFKVMKYLLYPLLWALLRTPKKGAECSIYCAVKPNLIEKDGFYFRNCESNNLLPHACNKDDAIKLWNTTENMLKEYHV